MNKQEIGNRLEMVCKALDSVSVSGIQNVSNIAGCYAILNDIITDILREAVTEEEIKQ